MVFNRRKKRHGVYWKRIAKNILCTWKHHLIHASCSISRALLNISALFSFKVDMLCGKFSSTFQSPCACLCFSFSDVQRGRAAGASVSAAEQQLAVQRHTKSQCCLTVLLLLVVGCRILPCYMMYNSIHEVFKSREYLADGNMLEAG